MKLIVACRSSCRDKNLESLAPPGKIHNPMRLIAIAISLLLSLDCLAARWSEPEYAGTKTDAETYIDNAGEYRVDHRERCAHHVAHM